MTKEEWQRENRILATREAELNKQLERVNKTIQNLKADFNKLDDKGPLSKAKAIDSEVEKKNKIEKELNNIKKEKNHNNQLRNDTAKQEKQQELKDAANIGKKFAKELFAASLEGVAALQGQGYENLQRPVNERVIEMPKPQTAMEKAIEDGKKRLEANSEAGDIEEAMKKDKEDKQEQQKSEEAAYKKENNTKDLTKEKEQELTDSEKKKEMIERHEREYTKLSNNQYAEIIGKGEQTPEMAQRFQEQQKALREKQSAEVKQFDQPEQQEAKKDANEDLKKQQEQELQARIEQRAKEFLENKQMTNSHKHSI